MTSIYQEEKHKCSYCAILTGRVLLELEIPSCSVFCDTKLIEKENKRESK